MTGTGLPGQRVSMEFKDRFFHPVFLIILFASLLSTACLTSPHESSVTEIHRATLDDCLNIEMKRDIPVSIYHYRNPGSTAEKDFSLILGYEEMENNPGHFAESRSPYVNFYYIVNGILKNERFTVYSGILIFEIWIYNPKTRYKICYQWRLFDRNSDRIVENADADIIVEDEFNTVKSIKGIRISDNDLSKCTVLYNKCIVHLQAGYIIDKYEF